MIILEASVALIRNRESRCSLMELQSRNHCSVKLIWMGLNFNLQPVLWLLLAHSVLGMGLYWWKQWPLKFLWWMLQLASQCKIKVTQDMCIGENILELPPRLYKVYGSWETCYLPRLPQHLGSSHQGKRFLPIRGWTQNTENWDFMNLTELVGLSLLCLLLRVFI